MTSSKAKALAALIARDCPQVEATYVYDGGEPYVQVVWTDATGTECLRIVRSKADWFSVKHREVLPGITLFLEPDGTTVFAAFMDNPRCPDGSIEGLGAVYFYANSPVASTSASPEYLAKCRVISQVAAWEIHPNLMERLKEVEYGEEQDDADDGGVRHNQPEQRSQVHRRDG